MTDCITTNWMIIPIVLLGIGYFWHCKQIMRAANRIEELEVEMHKEIALRDCATEQTELVARHFTREFETFASSTGELKL